MDDGTWYIQTVSSVASGREGGADCHKGFGPNKVRKVNIPSSHICSVSSKPFLKLILKILNISKKILTFHNIS